MTTPIERLRMDHVVIRAKLELLEHALTMGRDAVFAIRELVYAIGRRLTEHEQREDVELYPVIFETLADPQREFAKSMDLQHQELEYLAHALHLLTLRGTHLPLAHVRQLGEEFITLLREHMDREERLLFPVLERLTADREAPITINRILGMYPDAKQVFECQGIDCRREGEDFLDEVAWRHAVPLHTLLRELREAAHPQLHA